MARTPQSHRTLQRPPLRTRRSRHPPHGNGLRPPRPRTQPRHHPQHGSRRLGHRMGQTRLLGQRLPHHPARREKSPPLLGPASPRQRHPASRLRNPRRRRKRHRRCHIRNHVTLTQTRHRPGLDRPRHQSRRRGIHRRPQPQTQSHRAAPTLR